MSDLISRSALLQFPYSPESGTEDMIESWIEEAGLCGESVDFDEGITEKARELCKLVIQGYMNIIETEPTAYNVDAVVKELENEKEIVKEYEKYHCSVRLEKAIDIVQKGGVE